MRDAISRLLVRTFVRRFFENDLLAPDLDLRPLAIWIVALLATPATLFPVRLVFKYVHLAAFGPQFVEAASWIDKAHLITISMFACGAVAILSSEALLIDRRDALVLGALPLDPRRIVRAKLAAVLAVFGAVAVTNTAAAVVLFPPIAYSNGSVVLIVRAAAGHAVATMTAGLTTAVALAAIQVAALRVLSAHAARAVAPVLQAVAIGALVALLFVGGESIRTVAIAARENAVNVGSALYWPPVWFLGLYQFIQGTRTALFDRLALHAVVAMVATAAVAVPLMLLAWRHALVALIAEAPVARACGGRAGWRLRSIVSRAITCREPRARALGDLLVGVLVRTPRHRLVAMTAAGLAAVIVLHSAAAMWSRTPWEGRSRAEFVAPVLVLCVLMAAARWLLAVPVELPAAWAVRMAAPMPTAVVRRAVHRFLLGAIVLPVAALAATFTAWQGTAREAVLHGAIVLLAGLGAVELAVRRIVDLPCATEYAPGQSRGRWPFYAAILLFPLPPLMVLERSVIVEPGMPAALVVLVGLAGLAAAARGRNASHDLIEGRPEPLLPGDSATLDLSLTVAHRAPAALPVPLDTGPPRTETAR